MKKPEAVLFMAKGGHSRGTLVFYFFLVVAGGGRKSRRYDVWPRSLMVPVFARISLVLCSHAQLVIFYAPLPANNSIYLSYSALQSHP